MRSSIGNFIGVDRTVSVTFKDGTFTHKRTVNAVLKPDGSYDKAATKARVEEVAQGLARKREAGALKVPKG